MNVFTKGWKYIKDRFDGDDDKPVFRATVGEGLNAEQAKKAQEIVTKKPLNKSLFTTPVMKAELLPGAKEKIIEKAKKDVVVQKQSKQMNPIQFTAGQISRGLISASLAASGKNVYTPATEFEKALLGNNPIYNSKLTAQRVIKGEDKIDVINQGGAGMLALGLGINALDVSDIFTGGGKKTVLNKIAKIDNAKEILPELRKILGADFDNEMLEKAAVELSSMKDYTKVRDYIKDLSGINGLMTAKREAALIDKARDYKSPITRQSVDTITNSNDPEIISGELRKLGVESDNIQGLVDNFVKNNDPKDVYSILKNTVEQPKAGEMLGSINLEKLDMSPEAISNFKKHYQAVKDDIELLKGKPVTLREVSEAAEESEVLRTTFSREEAVKLGAQISKAKDRMSYLENLFVEAKNPSTQKQIMEEMWELQTAVDTAANFSGRLLNFFKRGADSNNGTVVNRILQRIKKTGADRTDVMNKAKDLDWNNPDEVVKFYREYVKPTWLEKLSEYRYNNMLSNPRSHIRNISTNVLHGLITRPLTRTVEAGIDIVSSALTGKARTVYLKEVPAYYKGVFKNTFNALGDAFDAMKGKGLATQFMETEGKIPTGSLPKFLRIPTLALEAGDRLFSRLISEGEKAALIKRGMSESEAAKKAAEAAQYSIFRQGLDPKNKTAQGAILSGIDKFTTIIDQLRKTQVGEWIVPFLRTPMNIAKQMVEYSPAGFINVAKNGNKKEALAKAFIGSAISAWAAKEAWSGNITWNVPKDAEEKELFYASGKKPFSFRVGDKWVPMIYFGPLAYAAAIPAAFKYYYDEAPKRFTDSDITKATKSIMGSVEFWTQQTFLENIGNMMDLVGNQDGKTLDKNLGFLSTQVIPLSGLLRYVATIVDPVFRKSNSLLDEIEKGLPFLSRNLDAYTLPGAPGISGQESKRDWFNYLAPWDIGSEKAEYNRMLELRREELDSNAWSGRNNEALRKQAQSMFDDFMTGKGGQGRADQIQKELSENEQLKNTFIKLVEKAGDIESAMIDPIFTFNDPKYTAEIIYFRSQTAETDEEWKENVEEFVKMLDERGLMTAEVTEELEKIITADQEKAKMEQIEEEAKQYQQTEDDWSVDISVE